MKDKHENNCTYKTITYASFMLFLKKRNKLSKYEYIKLICIAISINLHVKICKLIFNLEKFQKYI